MENVFQFEARVRARIQKARNAAVVINQSRDAWAVDVSG
jgi:hypothetical protein